MTNLITDYTAARDIATLLVSLGLGTIATDIFINREPDSSSVRDNIITLYDTMPHGPSEVSYSWERPSVQARVRHKGGQVQAGIVRSLLYMNALHAYAGTIGSNKYHLIRVINGPIQLAPNQDGRLRWTFNLEIHRST